jgi:hypothetical protein
MLPTTNHQEPDLIGSTPNLLETMILIRIKYT